jgi:hypothetical protein
MNKIEKELHGYINGAERYSGFDSYDSAEGDMSFFDDSDGSNFDGDDMSFADGASASHAQVVSDPYVLSYNNTTTADVTATLFGFNDNFGQTNFGNPTAVIITNIQGGTYGRLIAQSNNKQFVIGKWRFQCSTSSQLQQTLSINHVDGNGKSYITPLNLSVARDAYQQQADIIDVTKPVTFDGNTFITFTLKASAVLTISMYPVRVISAKAQLNGGHDLHSARAPRLSGKNVAPVIIQTTQDVRGVK